jgi:hypothetical protein
MARASLEVREEVCGLNHEQTLYNISILAMVLQYQGKYNEAESINRRALAAHGIITAKCIRLHIDKAELQGNTPRWIFPCS